jgi:hypothetical protein
LADHEKRDSEIAFSQAVEGHRNNHVEIARKRPPLLVAVSLEIGPLVVEVEGETCDSSRVGVRTHDAAAPTVGV